MVAEPCGVNLNGSGSHTVRANLIGGNCGATFDHCEAWGTESPGWSSGGYNVFEGAADCTAGVTSDFTGVTPVIELVGDWDGDTSAWSDEVP